ncbi:Uncharacterized protein APZ42_021338 [Daphnia magna]|uniref:Uncharacterized protein n=1 Tax=Daphnia magna TaxID=35525 RepID=A0A164WRT2_9CRUS|nr:Uncharacterized protein APZ42_021338 [Daphnia magna]
MVEIHIWILLRRSKILLFRFVGITSLVRNFAVLCKWVTEALKQQLCHYFEPESQLEFSLSQHGLRGGLRPFGGIACQVLPYLTSVAAERSVPPNGWCRRRMVGVAAEDVASADTMDAYSCKKNQVRIKMGSADSEKKYKARRKRRNEFARLKRLKELFSGTGIVKLGDYKTRGNPKKNNTEVMAACALDIHDEKAEEPQEFLDSIDTLFVDENSHDCCK